MDIYLKKNRTTQKQRMVFVFSVVLFLLLVLSVRLGYLMLYQADHLGNGALNVHQRERAIKAARV